LPGKRSARQTGTSTALLPFAKRLEIVRIEIGCHGKVGRECLMMVADTVFATL
jgi:hypothetical protein